MQRNIKNQGWINLESFKTANSLLGIHFQFYSNIGAVSSCIEEWVRKVYISDVYFLITADEGWITLMIVDNNEQTLQRKMAWMGGEMGILNTELVNVLRILW